MIRDPLEGLGRAHLGYRCRGGLAWLGLGDSGNAQGGQGKRQSDSLQREISSRMSHLPPARTKTTTLEVEVFKPVAL